MTRFPSFVCAVAAVLFGLPVLFSFLMQCLTGVGYPAKPTAAINAGFLAGHDVLVFGLCNDALGYFVPGNDYSASNKAGHYEETVSTGSSAASALSQAFAALLLSQR